MAKTLNLSLHKAAFDITGSEEKPFELRKSGKWILSRLFYPDGRQKKYDIVKLSNGYGENVPFKKFKFEGFEYIEEENQLFQFSNGLIFLASKGDVKINIGALVEQRLEKILIKKTK